jgi:hypothetical protein
MDEQDIEPIQPTRQRLEDRTPFLVAGLPILGYVFFAVLLLVAIVLFWTASEKQITLLSVAAPVGVISQGVIVGGLLQAVGYIAALLEEIADSLRD